jgi:Holliday junction resolvasome RuvABC endonuclease subunit
MEWPDIICVEIPVGSQSARAMASYGICIGVLASINKPMIQVTPTEVKVAATGNKSATKREMIIWAFSQNSSLKWLTRTTNGDNILIDKNEHMADAMAAIKAGISTDEFKTILLSK